MSILCTVCSRPTRSGGDFDEFRYIISNCDLRDEDRPRNFTDNEGMTLLMHAAQINNYQIVDELLRSEYFDTVAELDTQDMYGKTALYHAVENDHMAVVRALIQAGSNVNVTDIYGRSVVDIATNHKVKRLLQMREEVHLKKVQHDIALVTSRDGVLVLAAENDAVMNTTS